jgi:hypothetical protein
MMLTYLDVSQLCSASALRVTDSETYRNISHNNIAKRGPSATCCGLINNQNCAYGASFDGTSAGVPLQFTSQSDSSMADSAMLFLDWDGPANQALLISQTFSKGSNADSNFFHFTVFRNGAGTVSVHIRDASFGSSVNPTDVLSTRARSEYQGPNTKTASLYIDWTHTVTVHNQAGNPIVGATAVPYTDTLSNQECSTATNSAGAATCLLTQYRVNNDTGASQIENRNPFSFTISAPRCITQNGQESITAPSANIKQLSGC